MLNSKKVKIADYQVHYYQGLGIDIVWTRLSWILLGFRYRVGRNEGYNN